MCFVLTFQSTLPVRGATNAYAARDLEGHISIHAPREGSDGPGGGPEARRDPISIHAPREGSDLGGAGGQSDLLEHFNPRSP